jgi:hypothetical protein
VAVATIVAHAFTVDLVGRLLGLRGETRPGLLIVKENSWTVALARQMHEIGAPMMLIDTSWARLAPARHASIPTYHGEILNEATEHNLDLAPFQVLVAATENEAYSALVCSEFAPEIRTDSVYQLGEGDDDDHRALPASLRGRALFASGFGVGDVQQHQREGWEFRRTTMSEKFALDDAKITLSDAANMLLIVKPDGRMRFFTHASAPEPQLGDTIISYSPPRRPRPEKAVRRKEKQANSARKAQPAS